MEQELERELIDAMGGDSFASLSNAEKGIARKTWSAQQQFLAGYREGGTVTAGCQVSGVSRRTVRRWKQVDTLGFRTRYDEAHGIFGDKLESIALELVQSLRPGQNSILLLAMLNAHRPELYRPASTSTDSVARDTLAELRRLRQHVDTGTKSEAPVDTHAPGSSEANVDKLLREALHSTPVQNSGTPTEATEVEPPEDVVPGTP